MLSVKPSLRTPFGIGVVFTNGKLPAKNGACGPRSLCAYRSPILILPSVREPLLSRSRRSRAQSTTSRAWLGSGRPLFLQSSFYNRTHCHGSASRKAFVCHEYELQGFEPVAPSNGFRPRAFIQHHTKAKMSLRASSVLPEACSGDM